jgi:cytochrome P450
VLLAARDDDGAHLSDEELWEDIHDVMGAGHETTATTAAAALYCVAGHPAVEARLRAELTTVCGALRTCRATSALATICFPSDFLMGPVPVICLSAYVERRRCTHAALLGRHAGGMTVQARVSTSTRSLTAGNVPPTFDALENMPYLKQVVKEVLRLYPAIPVFPREAKHADTLASGHHVDAGDVVFMSSYALGRSAALWDDPLVFDPDRFAPEAAKRLHRFQWMPFGGGPRMCLGAPFAQMTVALMTVTLMQRVRFRLPVGAPQLIPAGYDITMNFSPTGGLHMLCEPL